MTQSLVRDEFEVVFAIDRAAGRIGVLYTEGLDSFGLPELAIEPPAGADPPPSLDWGHAGAFLAQALAEVAECAIDHGTVDVRPVVKYLTTEDGAEGVRFRVRSANEMPGEVVAQLAGAGGGAGVRGVTCSWWSA